MSTFKQSKHFVRLSKMSLSQLRKVEPYLYRTCSAHTSDAREVAADMRAVLFDKRVVGIDLKTGFLVYAPRLEEALLNEFGGGEISVHGMYGRGYTKLELAKRAPKTLKEVTWRIKAAMKAAGYKDQKCGSFPTREISDTNDVEYYVMRGEWNMKVITLEGTEKAPVIVIQ